MAGPNIGQSDDISFDIKGISGEAIKNIEVLADGADNSIFGLLFSGKGDGEKKGK